MTNADQATNADGKPFLDFALLTKETVDLARHLGIELIAFPDSFGAYKDGDVISDYCTPSELRQWLSGYLNGKEDALIVEQVEQVKPLLAELAKAEVVIQVLLAQMPDKKRKAADDALQVSGFSLGDPLRIKARREVTSAARSTLAAVAASGSAA